MRLLYPFVDEVYLGATLSFLVVVGFKFAIRVPTTREGSLFPEVTVVRVYQLTLMEKFL